MRHLLATLLFLSFCAVPALAQDDDSSVFSVADVMVDVTADSAVHARDQAIAQAQRNAFTQLLDRLNADPAAGTKLSNDDIATLVQNFEVQSERTSAVRYIGTFTVQFRPTAVKNYLGQHNSSYNATRGKPVVVLPVLVTNGHPILWEDKTKWRTAWDNDARSSGIVPVIIPPGELPDVTLISTADALKGKSDALKAIAERYNADGVIVATLDADLDKFGQELKVTVDKYDGDGDSQPETHFTLPAANDKPALDSAIIQAVKQIRHQLEKDWRQQEQDQQIGGSSTPAPDEVTVIDPQQKSASHGPTTHLPVVVSIQTLPEWAQIKRKLDSIPYIDHVDVIVLQRGSTNIEIEFHSTIDTLQLALMQQGLILKQDTANMVWTLQQNKAAMPY